MNSYAHLVSSLSDNEDVNVAVGLRPSGRIHLGNMATMGLAARLCHDVGPHIATARITVCDYDLPDRSDWDIRKNGFIRYFDSIPAPGNDSTSLLDHATEGIDDFLEGLSKHYGIKFTSQKLSDLQRLESYRQGLRNIFDTQGAMQNLYPKVPEGCVLAYPICGDCNTAGAHPNTPYRSGTLITSCTNPECSVEEFDMDIMDCSKDVAVHFFIDPLRDKCVEPRADVHVFGGDYGLGHNNTEIAKITKIIDLMTTAAPDISNPEILIGPIFYARDGTKMSKSKNNGLNLQKLKQHFGNDYVENIGIVIDHISEGGYKHVDYKIVDDIMFKNVY